MKQKEAGLCAQSGHHHCATLGKVSDPSRSVRMRPSHRAAVRSPDQGLGHACSRPSRPSSHLSSYFSNSYLFVQTFLSYPGIIREHINGTILGCVQLDEFLH